MAYTTPIAIPTGTVMSAAQWNTYVGANLTHLGTDHPSCRAYIPSPVSTSNSSASAVVWTAEDWDYQSCHSTVTNTQKFTAPIGGAYRLTGHILWNPGGGIRSLWVTTAATGAGFGPTTADTQVTEDCTGATGVFVGQEFDWVGRMNATDWLTVFQMQTSGGALNIIFGWAQFDWIGL